MADQFFEAAATNFLQFAALSAARGLAVVIDGDMQLLPQPSPEIVREIDADAHRQIGKGDEGDHVDRAHSWMLAAVVTQVDPLCRHGRAGHCRIDSERGLRDEGDDHAVVGGVGLDVDHAGARGFDRIGDGGDDVEAAAFREIGDALYKGSQSAPPTTVCRTRFTPT